MTKPSDTVNCMRSSMRIARDPVAPIPAGMSVRPPSSTDVLNTRTLAHGATSKPMLDAASVTWSPVNSQAPSDSMSRP